MDGNSKMGTIQEPGLCSVVPTPLQPHNKPSQYLKVGFSTRRYQRINQVAQECGCSWQQVALAAIDWYLNQFSKNYR